MGTLPPVADVKVVLYTGTLRPKSFMEEGLAKLAIQRYDPHSRYDETRAVRARPARECARNAGGGV